MKIALGVLAIALLALSVISLFVPISEGQKGFGDEATVVKRGKVTDEERAFSNEYSKLYSSIAVQKLTALSKAERTAGVQQGVFIAKEKPYFLGIETPPAPQEFLRDLSCKADAVILGTPVTKVAHLTADETFVYSQYEVRVEKILKDNLAAPIRSNTSIPVTRPGGLVKVNDQLIRVEDKNFETLKFRKEYILFLRYVPDAYGYMMSEHDGDLILNGDTLNGLSNLEIPEYLGRDLPIGRFFEEMSLAVARGCVKPSEDLNVQYADCIIVDKLANARFNYSRFF